MSHAALSQLVMTAGQFHAAGRLPEAEGLYRKVLAQDPNRTDALCGLGLIASQTGRHEEALHLLRWEVVARAGNPLLLVALAASLLAIGGAKGAEGAILCARKAIDIDPEFADAYNNLGCALQIQGRFSDAAVAFRAAIGHRRNYPEAQYNLGRTLYDAGALAEAVTAYREALALQPRYPAALFNLGFALRRRGQLDEAATCFREAVSLAPGFSEAMHNLGVTLAEKGQVRDATEWHKKALIANPRNMLAHSGLMYLLQFNPDYTSPEIAAEAKRWDEQHAAALFPLGVRYGNDRSPERRLKIGYVSPDFYAHAQCRFTLPFFEQHDHAQCEIHLYSSVRSPDAITEKIRATADVWHDVVRLHDSDLAEKIHADGIDIVIDLSMHMENHRLMTFAQKPTPVQMTWLAYPTCPGVSAIDYRITDVHLDPPTVVEAGFPERPVYISELNFCYHPVTEAPEVAALPAAENGYVTFGSLNNFRKMSPDVVAVWGALLREMPGSKLIMLCPLGDHREALFRQFAEQAVAPERIALLTHLPGPEYLRQFGEIDIALDPFPYNGITTTCDALYMGVPVLTLMDSGRGPGTGTAPSRAAAAILRAMQMEEWVAESAEDFVRRGVALSGDVARLAELRRNLRQRMTDSPVMDAAGFARKMEAAYRKAWREWCQAQV